MTRRITFALVAVGLAVTPVAAQTQPVAPPSGQRSLAATLEVYVFPSAGQTADRQSQDESECYGWAVQNTGTDPFDLAERTEQQKSEAEQSAKQKKQATQGTGARGAVSGAAAGALIGEIASDDAGQGAAYGAAAGLLSGRRRAASANRQAQAEARAQVQQAESDAKAQMEAFRKAFSVCLEAKKYMVKY